MAQSKFNIENYVDALAKTVLDAQPVSEQGSASLEALLRGRAIELWSDSAGGLFIVADDKDARRLNEPRGNVYTAAELQLVVQIVDLAIVLEIHEWKRMFNGRVRELDGIQ